METITKKTRAVGTSAGVLLPRSWLNKRVVVTLEEKNIENITKEIISKINTDILRCFSRKFIISNPPIYILYICLCQDRHAKDYLSQLLYTLSH